MKSSPLNSTISSIPAGLSSRSNSDMPVRPNAPSECSSTSSIEVAAHSRRRSAAASVSVTSARSFAVRGPSARWSAIRRVATTCTIWEIRLPLVSSRSRAALDICDTCGGPTVPMGGVFYMSASPLSQSSMPARRLVPSPMIATAVRTPFQVRHR